MVKVGSFNEEGGTLYAVSRVDPRFGMVKAESNKCKQVPKSSNPDDLFVGVLPRVLVKGDLPRPHTGGEGSVLSMWPCHKCSTTNQSSLAHTLELQDSEF